MFRQRNHSRFLVASALISLCGVLMAVTARADDVTMKRARPVFDGTPAEITMNVPLSAIIFIDGQRTYNSGVTRRFFTPPLAPEDTYFYDVKVTWIEGNRAKVYNRHLSFRAGERVMLNLARNNWTEYEQDLYMDPAAPAPWRTDYYLDPLNAPNYPNTPYIFPGTRFYPR